MINLLNNIDGISIPDDAYDFSFEWSIVVDKFVLTYKTPYRWDNYKRRYWNWACKYAKEPKIMFTSDTATEEDCTKVVEKIEHGKKAMEAYDKIVNKKP